MGGLTVRTGDVRRGGLRRALATGMVALAGTSCAGFPSIPPFYEVESDLPGGIEEERYLFGLAVNRTEPDGAKTFAARPFYLRRRNGDGERTTDVLAPIVQYTRTEQATSTTVWPLYFETSLGTDEDREIEASDDDTILFPILARGHEPGEGGYGLFFPFWGDLKGKLLTDEMEFRFFPAYTHIQRGEWESTHVLWPLIAWGEDDKKSHFRVLPFWMQSDGPKATRRSVLWPIVHWGTETSPERTTDGWFVFPLVGHREARDGTAEQWTFLYPFFQFSDDETSGDRHRAILWPFHQTTERPGEMESVWWWPFWGEYRSEVEHSNFYAWPLGWSQDDIKDGEVIRKRRYFVPFWMRSEEVMDDEGGLDVELRSWPFFSWEDRANGDEVLRVPELVPVFNWSAGETLYTELLSLFHWRADGEGREAWDGPLGLVRYRRGSDGERKLTLLWWIDIPLGSDE